MPITARVRTRLIDAVNVMFGDIGKANGTKPPKSTDNKGPAAWEYWLSAHLLSLAKGRFDLAREGAIDAGVIFDHRKSVRPAGTNEQVYAGDQVSVWLTVKNAAKKVDAQKMRDYLAGKGVREDWLDEAMTHATSYTRPAHEFRSSLTASD